jgi:hypothetical protein
MGEGLKRLGSQGPEQLGETRGKHGYEVAVDKTLDAVNLKEYSLLVLPGGMAPGESKERNEGDRDRPALF